MVDLCVVRPYIPSFAVALRMRSNPRLCSAVHAPSSPHPRVLLSRATSPPLARLCPVPYPLLSPLFTPSTATSRYHATWASDPRLPLRGVVCEHQRRLPDCQSATGGCAQSNSGALWGPVLRRVFPGDPVTVQSGLFRLPTAAALSPANCHVSLQHSRTPLSHLVNRLGSTSHPPHAP